MKQLLIGAMLLFLAAFSAPQLVASASPRLSITGACDTWRTWTPVWVVTNSGGPAVTDWISYSVYYGQFFSTGNTFHMEANSSTNIGSFLFGPFFPVYTLKISYHGVTISNKVDCSAGVPKVAPTLTLRSEM